MNKSLFHGKVEQAERRKSGGGGKEEGELQQLSILEQDIQAEREKVISLWDQMEQREMEILEHKGKQSRLPLDMQPPFRCIVSCLSIILGWLYSVITPI